MALKLLTETRIFSRCRRCSCRTDILILVTVVALATLSLRVAVGSFALRNIAVIILIKPGRRSRCVDRPIVICKL